MHDDVKLKFHDTDHVSNILVNLLWLPWCMQAYRISFTHTYLGNFPIGFLNTEQFVEGCQEVAVSERQERLVQYMRKRRKAIREFIP